MPASLSTKRMPLAETRGAQAVVSCPDHRSVPVRDTTYKAEEMRQSKQFGGIFELQACRNATPLVRRRRGPTQPRRQAFHSDFQQRNFTSGDPHHSGFAGRSLSVSKLAIRQVRVSIFHINNYIPQRRIVITMGFSQTAKIRREDS
jgi:hypothetical protein